MTLGQWERWEPIKNLSNRSSSNKYSIVSIINNTRELEVVLDEVNSNKDKIRILFKNSVHAYRRTNESFWINGIAALDEEYGGDFYATWAFFKVYNSEYLISMNKENLLHFSLFTYDDFLDVIADTEPLVEFVKATD